MKLTKENIYIDLRGKSREELTDLYNFLESIGEELYADNLIWFLNYSNKKNNVFHCNRGYWMNPLKKYVENKQEVTIQQLKEILQPMETFTPIAMKCTQEQFNAVKPKLIGLKIIGLDSFTDCNYLVNNLGKREKLISNITPNSKGYYNRKVHEQWNEETFLKACGIEVEQIMEKEFNLSMCRIIVDNAEQSKKIQELAFKQGFSWGLIGKIVTNTHVRVLYFNSEDYHMTFSDLDYNDSNFKTFHFTDVFKEPLQEKEQRLLKELEEVRKEIEDSKIKEGDWITFNNGSTKGFDKVEIINSSEYNIGTQFCYYKESECKKITNQELIELLEQEMK